MATLGDERAKYICHPDEMWKFIVQLGYTIVVEIV